jgi:transposase-like protein
VTSVRQIKCPECDSISVETEPLEENNHSLNVKAKITCKKCEHVWEDQVSNPARRGFFMGLPVGRSSQN